MKQKEYLTNEPLRGICKSNFELVRYAILLARHDIKSGQEIEMDDLLEDLKSYPNLSSLENLGKEEQSAKRS